MVVPKASNQKMTSFNTRIGMPTFRPKHQLLD